MYILTKNFKLDSVLNITGENFEAIDNVINEVKGGVLFQFIVNLSGGDVNQT